MASRTLCVHEGRCSFAILLTPLDYFDNFGPIFDLKLTQMLHIGSLLDVLSNFKVRTIHLKLINKY